MSIIDELRKEARAIKTFTCMDEQAERLLAIADRIDKRYEEMHEFCERIYRETINRRDVTLWNVDYTALPVDADGVPIRIGDVIAYEDNTKPKEVVALVPPSVVIVEDGPRNADMCRHYHKPTVEDVLRQFLGECEHASMLGYTDMPQDIFDTYVAKLQLKEN